MSDADRLYEHLAATAELPVERSASRLLGEAEAVADDLRDADPDVQAERAAVVGQLLAKIEKTGNSEADEHVERARALAAALADE
ncbi:MAG: hypothetical protein ACI8U4_000214 [Natronomonas sp.]